MTDNPQKVMKRIGAAHHCNVSHFQKLLQRFLIIQEALVSIGNDVFGGKGSELLYLTMYYKQEIVIIF